MSAMKSRKLGAKAHATRSLVREVRQLLKATHVLGTSPASPRVPAPPTAEPHCGCQGKSPGDPSEKPDLGRALRTHSALSRAAGALRRIEERLPQVCPRLVTSRSPEDGVQISAAAERVLRDYLGPRGDELLSIVRCLGRGGLSRTYGVVSWKDAIRRVECGRDEHWFRAVRPAVTYSPLSGTGDGTGVKYEICGHDRNGVYRCTETDGATFWMVLLVFLGVALIKWVGDNIDDWFNETDDDDARDEINNLNCAGIVAKPDSHWVKQFEAMMDGPTGDEDEEAMLKVLNCLPPARVQAIVAQLGKETLMDEFQGTEFDELTIRLQQCGVLSFADWDDDASRMFINGTSLSTLAALPVGSIVQLCHNMFEGSCGDEDEQAIIKLLGCQDGCKLQTIVIHHSSVDEFDDNVDGDEWEDLSFILLVALTSFC